MGSFSWRSCKTGRAIPSGVRVTLLMPNNEVVKGVYRDYGIIETKDGDVDVLVLHAVNYDVQEALRIVKGKDAEGEAHDEWDEKYTEGVDTEIPHFYDWEPQRFEGEEIHLFHLRTDKEREIKRLWARSGCGFRLFRGNEYKPGMKYDDFEASYPCMDQGCVPRWDQSPDPRFVLQKWHDRFERTYQRALKYRNEVWADKK